jgi:hypothetical protein
MACQLVDIATAPLVLCRMDAAPSVGSAEIACTCPQGPNAECPMHEDKRPTPSSGESRLCAGCAGRAEMVLTTLIGFAGPVVDRHQTVIPEGTSEPLTSIFVRFPDVDSLPLFPPPRS